MRMRCRLTANPLTQKKRESLTDFSKKFLGVNFDFYFILKIYDSIRGRKFMDLLSKQKFSFFFLYF